MLVLALVLDDKGVAARDFRGLGSVGLVVREVVQWVRMRVMWGIHRISHAVRMAIVTIRLGQCVSALVPVRVAVVF